MPSAFVTGGSGFIGGALIRRLRHEGWEVRALARSCTIDITRAREEPGYAPVRTIDEGMEELRDAHLGRI